VAINHGPTTALYYEDPDGIRLEHQAENFPTPQETADHFGSTAYRDRHRPGLLARTAPQRCVPGGPTRALRRHPPGHKAARQQAVRRA